MFYLGLAEDSLHDNLEDLFTDLEAFSHSRIKAILIKQLAVANEHLSQFAHLAFEVVWCDLIELQAHLLNVILLRILQLRVSLGHGLHLVPDLSHFFLFLGRGWPLPVIFIVVVVLWAMHSSLESIVLIVSPATPTLSTLIVIIIATTTSTSAWLIIVSPLLAAFILTPCELLRFAIISTSDQALMHTHLHNILRQFHNAFHDVTEIAKQLHRALVVLLHFVQGLLQIVDLLSILLADILALDVHVGAFYDPLKQEHRLLLGRLNWLRRLCGYRRWSLWLECWRLRIHALLHCATCRHKLFRVHTERGLCCWRLDLRGAGCKRGAAWHEFSDTDGHLHGGNDRVRSTSMAVIRHRLVRRPLESKGGRRWLEALLILVAMLRRHPRLSWILRWHERLRNVLWLDWHDRSHRSPGVLVQRHRHRTSNSSWHRHHGLAISVSCDGVEILARRLLWLHLHGWARIGPLDLVDRVAAVLRLIAAAVYHVVIVLVARLETLVLRLVPLILTLRRWHHLWGEGGAGRVHATHTC